MLDPMVGRGTTAVAAVRLGMRCIGIDADSAALESAQERTDAVVRTHSDHDPSATDEGKGA